MILWRLRSLDLSCETNLQKIEIAQRIDQVVISIKALDVKTRLKVIIQATPVCIHRLGTCTLGFSPADHPPARAANLGPCMWSSLVY
jgi:hypothetical protein